MPGVVPKNSLAKWRSRMSRRRIVVYTVRRYDWAYNDEYHYEDRQSFVEAFLSREKAEARRKELESGSTRGYEECFSVVEHLVELED
jgi:hypothetical protein